MRKLRLHSGKAALAWATVVAACLTVTGMAATRHSYDASGNLQQTSPSIAALPVIVTEPGDWTGVPGSTAVFSVRTQANASNTFQWRKDTAIIPGATLETLVLPNVGAGDEGFYEVVVTNPKGFVKSRAARLSLDTDSDGMADWQELAAFGSLSQAGSGDLDGDGITNAEELADGTNPKDRTSRLYRLALLAVNGRIQATPESATGRYAPGTRVTLKATPSDGFSFIEWQGQAAGVLNTVALTLNSDATVEAVFGSSLEVALDAPDLSWQTGSDAPWTGQGVIGHGIAEDWGQSATLTDPGQSWCAAYVNGPATVSFRWQVPSGSAATLKMYVDNTLNRTATANGQWQVQSVSVSAGRHLVRWMWEKLAGAANTPDVAWLDAVAVSTSSSVTLAQAVDAGELPWATDRMNPWFGTDQLSHDLADSASVVLNGQYLTSWLETRVNGAGQLGFWYRSTGGTMNVQVDGGTPQTLSGGWSKVTLNLVGAGPHTIRWNANTIGAYSSTVSGTMSLDEVTWLAGFAPNAPPPTLAVALDNTNLVFLTGGKKPWMVTTENTRDAVDAAKSGAIGHKADSWIETKVAGPIRVNFYWRVQCDAGDKLQVLVDGAERGFITGSTSWASSFVQIAETGLHTVRWRYLKNESGAAGLDMAWLDAVSTSSYSPGTPAAGTLTPDLAEAVDNLDLRLRTGGNAAWTLDAGNSHGGNDGARTGTIANSQETWTETAVNGSGKLTFWWKVSSEPTFDYLSFNIDGVEQARISGEQDWTQKVFNLSGNTTHLLRWRYVKNGSTVAGTDAGWVDQVAWTGSLPESTSTLSTVLLNVGPQAGSYSVYITEAGAWTAAEDLAWASLNSAGGTGNASLTVSVAAQTSKTKRSGVLSIAGWKILLNQEGYVPPVIAAPVSYASGGLGVPFTLSGFSALNFPQEWSATGLPPGLIINKTNAAISGTPTKVGEYSASIVASNLGGKSAPAKLFFVIRGPTLVDYSGDYVALVPPGTTLTRGLGGVLNLKVAAGKSASGVLQLGTQKLSFTSAIQTTLAGNPLANVSIPRPGTTALKLTLEFDTSRWVGFFTGTVEDSSETLAFSGWKNLWSVKSNPATELAGYFTSSLGLGNPAQIGQASIPQGAGYLLWTVSSGGVVTYSGKAADGTAIVKGQSILWPDGQIPVFALLPNGGGSLRGMAAVETDGIFSGRLDWTKLPGAGAARTYQPGFAFVPLEISGGKWAAPAKGGIVLGLAAGPNNARIEFADGGIESAAQFANLDQIFELTAKPAAVFSTSTTTNPAGIKLTIDADKGTFLGSMTLSDGGVSRPVSFEGALLSGDRSGAGFFLLPNLPLGNPPSSPILSGSVLISPNP